jgi:hypothetical protein
VLSEPGVAVEGPSVRIIMFLLVRAWLLQMRRFEQRHLTLEEIYGEAMDLTDGEIATPQRGAGGEKSRSGREGVMNLGVMLSEWITLGHD